VRVPMYKPGKEKSTRVEFRCPDPACNPYLSFSLMLAAGMEGIKNKYPLPEPIEENIFEMDIERRKEAGIETLPDNLFEALQYFEKSKIARETLGDHIFFKFIENKKIEWDRYRIQVTDYELENYLPIL
jgi:glutamine synthetase